MGSVVQGPDVEGISLTFSTTSLDFGKGVDGLIALSGMRRLEEEHGMRVHFGSGEVSFRNPPLVFMSGTYGPARKASRRAAELRRLQVADPHRFQAVYLRALRGANATSLGPAEVWEHVRSDEPPETVEDERDVEAVEREQRLKAEFADVFAEELTRAPCHVKQSATLVRLPPVDLRAARPAHGAMHARIPQTRDQREFISREFSKLRKAGILEPTTSPLNAPVFCVDKDRASNDPSRHYRAVFNFKPVNRLFPRMPTAFPRVTDILEDIAGKQWVAASDITAAFHQVAVHPDDRQFLVVTDPLSREKFQFTAWPFGFAWSPYAMQIFGEPLTAAVPGAHIYMDDVSTGADTLDEMEDQWRVILQRCRERGVK